MATVDIKPLDRIINVDGQDYSLNAENAETANKVANKLIIKKTQNGTTTTVAEFDGSAEVTANIEIQAPNLSTYATKTYVAEQIAGIDVTYTNTNETVNAFGGVAAGTSFNNIPITEVLDMLLYPYIAPTLNSITLSEAAGTFEYGTKRTISKVTPNFTKGSKNITSIKIGTTSGGSDLYSGSTATSGTAITLANPKIYDGNTGGTIYCTISDGQQSSSKTTEIKYAYYTYYAVTDSTAAPTSWTPVGSTSVTDITIEANAGQYIWIASTGNYSGICELNELSGKYNSASETIKTTSNTLVNSKNYTCTNKYNFYRLTSARSGSGSSKFKLA